MLDFFFFKSQEDGLGSAENKETAKNMQNQEVKMSAGSQECQFLLTFLLSYLSLFFLVSLLPLSIPSFHKYYGEPMLNKTLCQARHIDVNQSKALFHGAWVLGIIHTGGLGSLGGSKCDDSVKGPYFVYSWILTLGCLIQRVLLNCFFLPLV